MGSMQLNHVDTNKLLVEAILAMNNYQLFCVTARTLRQYVIDNI